MASRAQWRFGIFVVGLQMAIKLNQVNIIKCIIYCLQNGFIAQVFKVELIKENSFVGQFIVSPSSDGVISACSSKRKTYLNQLIPLILL